MGRLEQFRDAQAKAIAVANAVKRAGPAEKAAKWFSQYANNCTGKDAGSVEWTPSYASSCTGASEAADYIEAVIIMMLPTIVSEAEDLANAELDALIGMFPVSIAQEPSS